MQKKGNISSRIRQHTQESCAPTGCEGEQVEMRNRVTVQPKEEGTRTPIRRSIGQAALA